MKTLILFNRTWTFSTDLPEEVRQFTPGEETIWVALSPWAMATLDTHKIPYSIPDDYTDQVWVSDLQTFGLKQYREVLRIMRQEVGARLYPEVNGELWEQDWWDLRFLHDGLLIRLAEMAEVLEVVRPDAVLYLGERIPPAPGFEPDRVRHYETILASLAPSVGARYLEHVTTVPAKPGLWRDRLARWVHRLRLRVRGMMDRPAPSDPSALTLLALDRWYNWDSVFPVLSRRGLGVIEWDRYRLAVGDGRPLAAGRVARVLEAGRSAWNSVTYRGVPLFPLIKGPLARYVAHRYPLQVALSRKTQALIREKAVQVVTASVVHTLESSTVKWAARQAGVPVCCWYHGGYIGYVRQENVPYLDGDADYLLSYGPGVVRYVRQLGCRAEPVNVGATMFPADRVPSGGGEFLEEAGGRKLVLLTLTNVAGPYRYLQPSTYSDTRMWRNAVRILDVLSRHRNRYFLFVKRHPEAASQPPLEAAMRELFGADDYADVFREPKFGQLLSLVDSVIHLVPSSTLVESIQGRIPVACYLTPGTLTPEGLALLRKRVLAEEDLSLFCERLDAHLASGEPFADPSNTEFRDTFARAVTPEAAIERILPLLRTAASEAGLTRRAVR